MPLGGGKIRIEADAAAEAEAEAKAVYSDIVTEGSLEGRQAGREGGRTGRYHKGENWVSRVLLCQWLVGRFCVYIDRDLGWGKVPCDWDCDCRPVSEDGLLICRRKPTIFAFYFLSYIAGRGVVGVGIIMVGSASFRA